MGLDCASAPLSVACAVLPVTAKEILAMERVRDVMSGEPIAVDARTPIRRAAEMMQERDVGDVIVTKDGELYGILTDRDIVVRAVARDFDLDATVSDVCTRTH